MKNQEALGQFLLDQHKQINDSKDKTGGATMAEVAEYFSPGKPGWWAVAQLPENPKHDSMGMRTAEVYREQLRVEAEAGNKHSKAMLEALEKGVKPDEDPGGE